MSGIPETAEAAGGVHRFALGERACVALHDGDVAYTGAQYVANAHRPEVERALDRHGDVCDRTWQAEPHP